MAFVDLKTEKIYGTKEGSYTWYHELGHIKFNKSEFGNNFAFWKDQIFIWIVLSTSLALLVGHFLLKVFSTSLAVLFIFMYFFEEAWCWGYALKNKGRDNNGSK